MTDLSSPVHQPRQGPELLAAVARRWPPSLWQDVHVVVAASGGGDSMALLRILLALRPPVARGRLFVAHVNHRLRGVDADRDQRWLAEQTQRLGVELLVADRGGEPLATRGQGLEAAARQFRYRELSVLAARVGARFVATAHNRDDQVETVLFRLLRGTGLRGLGGMPFSRPLSPELTLVRPVLGCAGRDLRQYLAVLGQDFRDDHSNRDRRFARNWLRTAVLPAVRRRINPRADEALLRIASQAVAAQEVVDGLVDDLCRQLVGPESTSVARPPAGPAARMMALDVTTCGEAPALVVTEALRRLWRQAGWPERGMTTRHWERLATLASSGEGAEHLPGKLRAVKTGGVLQLGEIS